MELLLSCAVHAITIKFDRFTYLVLYQVMRNNCIGNNILAQIAAKSVFSGSILFPDRVIYYIRNNFKDVVSELPNKFLENMREI